MATFITILLFVTVGAVLFLIIIGQRKPNGKSQNIPQSYRIILNDTVPFYQKLSPDKKTEFETRMMHFLASTRITGVKTEVEEIDKIYIAASAIIPIFGFPKWEYCNLNEILLYPESFSHEFEQTGAGRNILGMVGEGALNHVMILSRHQLRQAFVNKSSKENTAIHEFVHLIDKSDGSIDGVPEVFVDKKYILPWLEFIRKEIGRIWENQSDIDPYGATNEAEFFSVVSEYFFERPDLLEDKHPELYKMLSQIFQQNPG